MKHLILFCLLSLSTHIMANDALPLDQLKQFLKSTNALSAGFKQLTLNENGQILQSSDGQFYLSRPGRFRWSYQQPFVQEIVSREGKVWFYDQDLEQVTIKKLDQSLGSTPALLLGGEIELEENFTLEQQGVDEDLHWIKLLPKNEESGFHYILIGMNNGQLGGMELSDNFGQLTRIYFSDLKINPELDSELFNFIPPEGVDVFEN